MLHVRKQLVRPSSGRTLKLYRWISLQPTPWPPADGIEIHQKE